ncbi:hypothetical protein [Providencia rettgeri]|uniref:hypothetical protein n=1 Tax=Providencia TaxID=586 RepID=UPI001BD66544|nr:hypothetical protein [Providencia rettgeri]ELR5069166.1 hypothetical protein [Providencia rettgeri]ELR5221380.1 hypothetical protein [Providencia rettgeri]MDX7322918.1 hypothetical protein [Providencia rettgeri]
MLGVGKKNFDEQKYSSMSLNDMVIAITKNPKVFEGKSYIIIDKIKTTKNKGEDGWAEINKSWGIVTSGKAKEKIDKYFKKGLKVDRDPSINKNVKINISDKETTLQPIDVKDKEISSAKNEYESSKSNGKIGKKLKNVVKKVVKNIESEMELKKSKRDEESEKINKVECDSFDDLINDFKTGEALSKNELSHIKFLMSYIRTKEPIENEDNIRKELEDVFVKITNSSMNIDDKYKVLHLYREQRFLSIYNSSCRVASYAIESLLEKQNFPREIITKVKDCLIDYSNEYLSEMKSNESEYNECIKNIKKYSDFSVFKGGESIEKIKLIKGILSESKYTSENRKFLTELSHNLTDERIIDFVKEKINSNIKLLKDEFREKCDEEKITYDKYTKEKNEIIDTAINRIKSILIVRKMPKSIVDSVIEVINKKRSNTEIELFLFKIDLIINILQYKGIKSNKITNDIEHYLDVSMDKLKLEVEIAKSKKISFQERLSSLLNNLNNRVLNFIYYVRHSFK